MYVKHKVVDDTTVRTIFGSRVDEGLLIFLPSIISNVLHYMHLVKLFWIFVELLREYSLSHLVYGFYSKVWN